MIQHTCRKTSNQQPTSKAFMRSLDSPRLSPWSSFLDLQVLVSRSSRYPAVGWMLHLYDSGTVSRILHRPFVAPLTRPSMPLLPRNMGAVILSWDFDDYGQKARRLGSVSQSVRTSSPGRPLSFFSPSPVYCILLSQHAPAAQTFVSANCFSDSRGVWCLLG